MSNYHIPVMLEETIQYLDIKPGQWYLDCTVGGGGHSEKILQLGGKVLGIDLDPEAIDEVARKHGLVVEKVDSHLQAISDNLILIGNNFVYVDQIVTRFNLKPSGILFDLGISSHQLETQERGFSFNLDAPLDMRMDKNTQIPTAQDLVNGLHYRELVELFWKLGEERFSKRIAKKIIEQRAKRKIETTNQLAQIILSVRKRTSSDRTHPATRVFQALRIAVNDELNSLREALPKALEVLEPSLSFPRRRESNNLGSGGRLVVISFHSLEDRIVKNFFKEWEQKGLAKILTKKPIEPNKEEINLNPHSRSGKLRAIEKLV